jgi:hypothetical protein
MTNRLKITLSVNMSIFVLQSVTLGYCAGASLGTAGVAWGAAVSFEGPLLFSLPFCFVWGLCDWCCDWMRTSGQLC